jgi:hypothetical protein
MNPFSISAPISRSLTATAEQYVAKIQKRIKDELGLVATAGIGPNMFLAKICLDNEGKKRPPYCRPLEYGRMCQPNFGVSVPSPRFGAFPMALSGGSDSWASAVLSELGSRQKRRPGKGIWHLGEPTPGFGQRDRPDRYPRKVRSQRDPSFDRPSN